VIGASYLDRALGLIHSGVSHFGESWCVAMCGGV